MRILAITRPSENMIRKAYKLNQQFANKYTGQEMKTLSIPKSR